MCNKCALCDVTLDSSNNSAEHVIPNAIGGFKKVTGFICNSCNNKTGHTWDTVLCKQFEQIGFLLQIKRERGELRHLDFATVDGNKIRILGDGSLTYTDPVVTFEESDDMAKISIQARNLKEAKNIIAGKYKKIKRERPAANITEPNDIDFIQTERELESPLHINLSYGGNIAGKSIVKSALALTYDSGVDVSCCTKALEFINNDHYGYFGFYYDSKDIILNRPAAIPLHCVHVQGDPATGLILGYVEYFGHARFVLLLSDCYSGEKFSNTYAINPLTGCVLDINASIVLTKSQLDDAFSKNLYDQDVVSQCYNETFRLIRELDIKREIHKRLNKIIDETMDGFGVEDLSDLSEEQIEILSGNISSNLADLIARNIGKQRR